MAGGTADRVLPLLFREAKHRLTMRAFFINVGLTVAESVPSVSEKSEEAIDLAPPFDHIPREHAEYPIKQDDQLHKGDRIRCDHELKLCDDHGCDPQEEIENEKHVTELIRSVPAVHEAGETVSDPSEKISHRGSLSFFGVPIYYITPISTEQ